jgi:hypothetical protein
VSAEPQISDQDQSQEQEQDQNLNQEQAAAGPESASAASPSKKKKNKKKKGKGNASTSQLDLSKTDGADPVGATDIDATEPVSEPAVEEKKNEDPVVVVSEPVDEGNSKVAEASIADAGEEGPEQKTPDPAEETEEVPESSNEVKESADLPPADETITSTAADDELSDPPLSKSTEHNDEELQKENEVLERKLNELAALDTDPDQPEQSLDEQFSLPPKSPAIPQRGPPPSLPPRSESPDAPATQKIPPPLPHREVTTQKAPPPPLPSRDHVATSAPILTGSSSQEGLRPFKNKATISVLPAPIASASEFAPPPLPPQLTAAQKAQHRPASAGVAGSIGSWFARSSSRNSNTTTQSEKSIDYDENYDLLLKRLTENNEEYLSNDGLLKEQLDTSHNELKSSFNEKVSEIESSFGTADETTSTADDSELHKVDWPFWTKVFNDYAIVAKTEPSKLSKEIAKGIPKQIRSIVWQLVSNSNPQQFEEQFKELQTQDSPFEKNIQMDLTRTSYISDYGISIESLHKVVKVYSLIDPEVGYTQGMAFIIAPLLLDMTELEAFSLFHKLMYSYNLRSLYLTEMPGLLLSLYQFDRLVEDTLPNLHTHFLRQGVRSSMYATQWFLTFFAYKFPLEFVLRIFDIVITEGFESILKFAIALVSKNEAKLLTLKFDALLEFLKENLFSAYLIEPEEAEEEGEDQHQTLKSNLGGFFKFDQPKPITVDTYNVNQFIEDATNVKLLPITLRRYAEEFEQIHQHEKERQEEVDELKLKNQQLRKEIRKVETSYTILNREHVQIANEIINNRIKVGTLEDEIKDLKSQNHSLRDRIISIQKQEVEVPADFENDLKNAMERNLAVMTQNQELEDQVSSLVQELEQLRTELENSKSVEPQTSQPAEQTHSKGWGKKFFK